MARMKQNPRYNVISLRLSDEEMDFLQEITKRDNKCISEIVRDALNHERDFLKAD
jgi:predicted DNA-binding protein